MKKKLLWISVALIIIVGGIFIGSLLTRKSPAVSSVSPTPDVAGASVSNDFPTSTPTDTPPPEPTIDISLSTPVPTAAPTPAPTSPPANSPNRAHSSLISDNSNPSVGSQATLTVTLANSSGISLSGLTVNLSTSDSGATFTNNGAVTDNAGQVKIQISSTNQSSDSIDVAVSGNGVNTTLSGLGSVSFQIPPTDTPTPTP